MLTVEERFRRAFLNYLKNPSNAKYKTELQSAAMDIDDAATQAVASQIRMETFSNHSNIHSHTARTAAEEAVARQMGANGGADVAGQVQSYISAIVQKAMQDIKISHVLAKHLYNFLTEISTSDNENKGKVLSSLKSAHYFTAPSKTNLLKEILRNFLSLQEKLHREHILLTERRNNIFSLSLTNSDVSNLGAKKAVIDELTGFVTDKIFSKSSAKGIDDFFPADASLKQNIRCIEKHIDSLSNEECERILADMSGQINPILHASSTASSKHLNADSRATPQVINAYKCEDNVQKRDALKVHSFDDNWFFTFLAKIAKIINEFRETKTFEEQLLEDSVNEIESTCRLGR